MQWQDEGIIIHVSPLGERKTVVTLLTAQHGCHGGVVRISPKAHGKLLLGTQASATWRARLDQHLGTLQLEIVSSLSAMLLSCAGPLEALQSACALCWLVLPERQPYVSLYKDLLELIPKLASERWVEAYINFEIQLLSAVGYGLDLQSCAVTGEATDLVAVSPRTGRAVSRVAAEPYKERLLKLPSFLISKTYEQPNIKEMIDGLGLTGYFLEKHVLSLSSKSLPPARERLLSYLKQKMKIE